jgi:hypothetical protein
MVSPSVTVVVIYLAGEIRVNDRPRTPLRAAMTGCATRPQEREPAPVLC